MAYVFWQNKLILKVLIVLGIFHLQLLVSCHSNEINLSNLESENIKIESKIINIEGVDIGVVIRKNKGDNINKPNLVLIHGTPGSANAWQKYLSSNNILNFNNMLVIERPGFGSSQKSGVIVDLEKQARLFSQLITENSIIIGHSLGAPIALWMALQNPQKVCAVVSIAGSLAPEYESPRWFNNLLTLPLINYIIPEILMSSNKEIMALQDELLKLRPQLKNLSMPFWLIQGADDNLVNPATVPAIMPYLPQKYTYKIDLENEGHLVVWENPELIINLINQINCSLNK